MDSITTLRGYDKVNDEQEQQLVLEDEDQAPLQARTSNHKHNKSLIFTISILSILFLTLTIALMLGVLIDHTNNEPPETPKASAAVSAASAAAAIKTVCNVTRFPESCFSTISRRSAKKFPPPNPTDPKEILNLAICVSIEQLRNVSYFLETMADDSNGPAPAPSSPSASASASVSALALADCKFQIDDAEDRLIHSLGSMESAVLTDAAISDIQTWTSAALTEEQTCLDGLEEIESAVAEEVKRQVKCSSVYTSNTLAIVANIHNLLQQFHMTLH